jgi:hypothetical protein
MTSETGTGSPADSISTRMNQWFIFETAGMPFFHARTLVLTSVVETSMLSP